MNAQDSIDLLNTLLVTHKRALPGYLSDAVPWSHRGNEAAMEVIEQIATAHGNMVDRFGRAVLDRDGDVAAGRFPLVFAEWHDLSVDFLLDQVIDRQRQEIDTIKRCVDAFENDEMGKALAEESLGEAKGHLESLLELGEPAAE